MPMYEAKYNDLLKNGAVIYFFGATGDLAKRKLYPALFALYKEGKLPERFAVIGLARRPRTSEEYRTDVFESIREFARYKLNREDELWERFASHFEYMSLDINDEEGFRRLNTMSGQLETKFDIRGNRLFYLALSPELFGSVSQHLLKGGLLDSEGWHRLVIEKPFGYDLQSAEKLNRQIREAFCEKEIYRIDHYLGKEMVQNIEVVRFANAFFEPLWNNKYISNIQITLSETVGVEDRGPYYDKSGALRDMAQNHMLQMVTMMAMEPPSRMQAEDIRDEKVKVLRSLRTFESPEDVRRNVVRGQYTDGNLTNKPVRAYRSEDRVNPASDTETYFAARIFIDNFRWAGVPFYVRTGKRMPVKTTEVVVEFKNMANTGYLAKKTVLQPNLLVFRVNPLEGIYIKINAKQPGSDWTIVPVSMDFCQNCRIGLNTPEAYERLLYDALRGDPTYFTRWDEVALQWKFIDPIASAWQSDSSDLEMYPAGSWGPKRTELLLQEDGFHWWPVNGQEESGVVWVKGQE